MKRRTSATLFVLAAALAVAGLLQNQPVFAGGAPTGGSTGAGSGGATVVSGPCFFGNGAGSRYEGNGTWVQAPCGQVNVWFRPVAEFACDLGVGSWDSCNIATFARTKGTVVTLAT